MAFLGKNYLIKNQAGLEIFEQIKNLPVIDPHNHANVKEIADNNCYGDAWQLFAATDHYVWEMLRKREVPEELITGKECSSKECTSAAWILHYHISYNIEVFSNLTIIRQ